MTALAEPGPIRLTEPIVASLARATPHLTARAGAAIRSLTTAATAPTAAAVDATVRELCEPVLARTIAAMIRDTVSVGVVRAGVKYNVIPGVAEIELDCRTLPGTDEPALRAELRRRIGEELWQRIEVECVQVGPPAQSPLDSPLYRLLEQIVTDHDPDGVPLPFLAPFATDAKHLARLGVPTYGFSPLKVDNRDGLLALMHGDDERVSVEALRWGLPVLADAVGALLLLRRRRAHRRETVPPGAYHGRASGTCPAIWSRAASEE